VASEHQTLTTFLFDIIKVNDEARFTALHGLDAGSQLLGNFVAFGLAILRPRMRISDERLIVGKATAG
jgi:hypothetical protein